MAIEPPYPSDLEAKGWNLDLDYERIEQSDTWAIASPEQRPWLLMLWLVAWRQAPVASLPDNDRLIAARIGMPVDQFTAWRDVLLSGWEVATDGRLYHRTMTQHALRMAEKRSKDRARVAAFRAKSTEVDASNACVTRYSTVSSTPTPTPTPKENLSPTGIEVDADAPTRRNGSVPFEKIVELYHETLPMLPRVEKLTKPRRGYIRQRWLEDLPDLDAWGRYFRYVSKSAFLTGQAPATNDRPPFRASLEWLCRPSNFTKVSERVYHHE
jgi:hypothetical protein